MPYSRQLPRIAANGRVAVKLLPAQRDQLLATESLPRDLGHVLHRARVARGKLEVRMKREELEMLIAAAITVPAKGMAQEQALDTFIHYLEDQCDRFDRDEA
jgi:hypothetical protein